MGNTLSLCETGHWDPHPEISTDYTCPSAVHQDMSQPLSHYFISSGHNSYLTSDQLVGDSGTSTIIMSLEAGCRVIELDCYTGPKGQPICKHGGTATKPVTFEECVIAIREHSFKASPYPVIITMENHADETGQTAMVSILKKQLGQQLYIPNPEDSTAEWASPESLKHRFLIRTNIGKATEELKRIVYIANTKFKGYAEMNKLTHVTSSSLSEGAVEKLGKHLEITRQATRRAKASASKRRYSGDGSARKPAAQKPPAALEEDDSEVSDTFTIQEAFEYATRHLLRVYPAGWRVSSNNYDPTLAWCLGASFVALNWQEWDKPLWINQGKFKDNGGCGYVQKPSWMLLGALPSKDPQILNVHVYSAFLHQGFNLLCGKDDLLVSMEVRGWHEDTEKIKTDYIQDSGRLKVEQDFKFQVKCPEMAVLLLIMQDHDIDANDPLGYFSLPLSSLKPGDYKLSMTEPGSGKPLPSTHCWIKVGLSWDAQDRPSPFPGVPTSNPLADH